MPTTIPLISFIYYSSKFIYFILFQNKQEEFKLRIYEVAHTWTIKAYLKFIMIKYAISITICLYPQVVYLFNTKAMEMSSQIELKQKI